jgi:peptidoglycan/xylan/chitin deacetylase (PgdA/CDA1 family)
VRGIDRLQGLVGHARRWISPGVVILLYHRIHSPSRDPQLLCVSPENFRKHLEIIRRIAEPISMQELSDGIKAGRVPRRAVVITFDDGYRDNLDQAKSQLEEYQIPATFFVVAGYIGASREFWWDELDRIFLSPGNLPINLRLKVGEIEFSGHLGDDSAYSEISAERYAGWDVTHSECPTARHRTYKALCRLLREASVSNRECALLELRAWANSSGLINNDNCAMTALELAQLSRGGFCEIGAHTLNHPRLVSISPCEQQAEIAGSKAKLEAMLGRPIAGFAYPFGEKVDYSSDSVSFVRDAGFEWACSNFAEVARPGVDRFQLPRIVVRNSDSATFSFLLNHWL